MLNSEQIEFYHEQGYLGIENVISPQEISELRSVTNEFIERSRQVTENDDVFDLEPDHSPQTPKLRRVKSPAEQHPVYNCALRHDAILDIVAQLIGPSIFTNGNKLNMKSAEFGSPVQWHQDWAHYPHTNDDILAVGVIIDDMRIENGCLQVIPKSHRGRILDHHFEDHFAGAVTEPDFDDSTAVPIELKAGGISIHHVRTLHGSLPNTSQHPRALLLFQYCAGDAWPLVDSDWQTYCSSFLRGEPIKAARVTEVPVRLPLPPPKRGGSIYENQSVLDQSTFKDNPFA